MINGHAAPHRVYSESRLHFTFRLDSPTMDSVKNGIRRTYLGNTAALVEAMLMQYASAYDYAMQSMPIWSAALSSASPDIQTAAGAYPPFLHYQFTDTKTHLSQEQGYFIRIRQFSSAQTAVGELYSPEPKTIILRLQDISPLYCCRDIANELKR